MVVDDDHNIVEVFCDLLQILGIEVIGRAFDGKEAVEIYQKFKPDLVILDLYMPGFDGSYALEKIREINSDAVVMMVTAGSISDTKVRFPNLNPTVLVHKPTGTEKILEIVSGLLSTARD
jgi:DNA-binding response OmpR family regulator